MATAKEPESYRKYISPSGTLVAHVWIYGHTATIQDGLVTVDRKKMIDNLKVVCEIQDAE